MNRNQFLYWAALQEVDECIQWPFPLDKHGYGKAAILGRYMTASRAVLILAKGLPKAPNAHSAHDPKCIARSCVNPRHLRWASPWENSQDRRATDEFLREMHGATFETVCQYCDDTFTVELRMLKRGRARFCSKSCAAASKRNRFSRTTPAQTITKETA